MLKRVDAVAESTALLTSEVRAMSRIFSDNQEVLVSMKSMVDGLIGAVEALRDNERRTRELEEGAQKIYAGLDEVRSRSDSIVGFADQASRLSDRIDIVEGRVKEASGTEVILKKIAESMDSIRDNSAMISRIADRIDGVGDGLREVSSRTETVLAAGRQIEEIKKGLWSLGEKIVKIEADAGEARREDMAAVRGAVESLSGGGGAGSGAGAAAEVSAMREQVGAAASRADAAAAAAGEIAAELRARAAEGDAREAAAPALAGRVRSIESDVAALAERADASAFAGESVKAVESNFARLRDDLVSKAESVERRVDSLADAVSRSEASASEFHAKADAALGQLRGLREEAGRASDGSSRDAMALLKLSEYQSGMRMLSESKYGGTGEIGEMADRTAGIINLFGGMAAAAGGGGEGEGEGGGMPLPLEVRQWAVSKMLECADRWDVRFSDALGLLVSRLGRDTVREAVRVRQVKDIYGARAASDMRSELGMDDEG